MAIAQKLLLFDIDGTLLFSEGAGRRTMTKLLIEIFGSDVESRPEDFAGSTDLEIMHTLLGRQGFDPQKYGTTIPEIIETYLDRLVVELEERPTIQVFDGVRTLLQNLESDERFALGLLTGNFERGAFIKLGAAGLDHHFGVGSYGSDHRDRNQLPPIALERATAHFQRDFTAGNSWIIGDTPKDIRCARAHGLRCMAVATGMYSADELRQHQPDALVDNFSDTNDIIHILAG